MAAGALASKILDSFANSVYRESKHGMSLTTDHFRSIQFCHYQIALALKALQISKLMAPVK